MSEEIPELIKAIRESEAQARAEMQEVRGEMREFRSSMQSMADNFSQYWQHLAVYEEDKKHDNEFKKDVRGHIADARPLLEYVREQKATTGKMKVVFYIAVMFAAFAALGFNIR